MSEEEMCPLAKFFPEAACIRLLSDGVCREFQKDEEDFTALTDCWLNVLQGAIQMPAFGVSIDSLTREEMKNGLWAEFCFDGERRCGSMPFDSLLIAVRGEYKGLNVVRKTEGKYQGRCFYIDLGKKDMSDFAACAAEKFLK